MKDWTTATVSVLIAVIAVAAIAVLVSGGAQTGNVLGAGGRSISQALACALSPVTGGSCGTSVTSSISF